MSDVVKISELPRVTAAGPEDLMLIVQNGESAAITVGDLAQSISAIAAAERVE